MCDVSECDVIGQTAATSGGASGCLSRGDVRAPVREIHRVTFAEDRNKYLNADDRLCDGLDFELELRLAARRASDDDDVELIPRHSIMKLPRPPRYELPLDHGRDLRHEVDHRRTSGNRILTKSRVACCAVIEDCVIPFAANAAAETANVVQWVGQPPKLSLHLGDLDPLIHGSLGPRESAPKMYLDRFSYFCRARERDQKTQRPIDRQIHTQTDRATPSVAITRVLFNACDAV